MSIIGLDVGTSRVKAVRFDDTWQAVDVSSEPSPVRRELDGRREQDMTQVWSLAARVIAQVAGHSPDPITLIAVTGQGDGCWLVDSAGRPAGPAMLWNDSRAAPIINRWSDDGRLDAAFRRNGCQGAPGMAHAQLTWLRESHSDVLDRAATLLSCGSWVYAQLTGRHVLEESEAANPFYDAARRRYDPELLTMFDLADLGRLLPDTVSGQDRVAPLRPEIADELGLDRQTMIALAPYDVPSTAIGTGVVENGRAFAVLGTTLCVGTVAAGPELDRLPNGMTLPGTGPDRWLIAYATMVGTEVLDWVATLLGLADAPAVTDLAATSRRADLPIVLPYLSLAGERSPFLSTGIRGTISGLDTGHSPADIARATVDALSLVVRDCLASTGAPPRTLALSGGGAASDLWAQSISDATDQVVLRPDVAEVGARGAVICAATDTGLFSNIDDAVRAAVHPGREFHPQPDRVTAYDESFRRLLSTRRALTHDRGAPDDRE